jgi:hypothetical protein|tara:strand:- start:177 stop:2111 length:1935 start_codon:yes stop_codon:yes gene_type:complete
MVINYTADQIGDIFYTKLVDAYENVEKILGWDIVSGISSPLTTGKLNFTEGSTVITYEGGAHPFVQGFQFIVGNETYTIDNIVDANTFNVTIAPDFTGNGLTFYLLPDANNQFTYEYSWSQEPLGSDGGQMTEYATLGAGLLALSFDPLKPLWIRVRLTAANLSDANKISLLSTSFTLQTSAGTVVVCPDFCGECTDPLAMDGCPNIVVECDDNLYNPYNLTQPSSMYAELSELAANIWGHNVKYFRVEPDKRSKDVILMEYSLYNVIEQGELKVVVPDNEMPVAQFSYDIFGMGFEDFEIHITKGQFKSAFGIGPSPMMRDYLYFPLINRMYEVNAVQYADEFNENMTYWRLFLKKFEERTSNIITDTAVEQTLENLTVGIDEIFGEEIEAEYVQTTKPDQYKTVYNEVGDGTRFRMHQGLKIEDGQIRNKWTVVSKNYYDLSSTTNTNIEVLSYNKKSELSVRESLALTMWVRPKFTDDTEQILFDGLYHNKGLKITISAGVTKVYLNGDMHQFINTNDLENKIWYGFVLNLNNGFKSMSVSIYRLDPSSNIQKTSSNTKTFEKANHSAITLGQTYGWVTQKNYQLMPAKLDVTNIRLFKKTIGLDQHMNILQQYVVRDNQLAHIIDNAIPSIGLRRYDQSR